MGCLKAPKKALAAAGLLLCLLAAAGGCALFGNSQGKKQALSLKPPKPVRGIAAAPSRKRRAQGQAKLEQMLKSGRAALSKAILIERNGRPGCFVTAVNQKKLIPKPIAPAPPGFPSSVVFKEGFPACGPGARKRLSAAAQRSFQAKTPCFFISSPPPQRENASQGPNLQGILSIHAKTLQGLIEKSGAGFLGYMLCGHASYIIEAMPLHLSLIRSKSIRDFY